MKLPQRALLLIGAALCIGGFFLPYLTLDYKVGEFNFSGLYYIQSIAEYLQNGEDRTSAFAKMEDKSFDMIYNTVIRIWTEKSGGGAWGLLIAATVVLMGPFYFLLFGLGYLYRGVIGKPFKRGVIFNLVFLAFAFLVFYLISNQIPLLKFNFLKMANIGYWMGFAGIFIAAFSDFFGKEELGA